MRTKRFVCLAILLYTFSIHASAVDVRLLKEVTLPFDPGASKYALKSGHLIVRSADKDRIIVYNNKGDVVFQWGPELERGSYYVDISYDGRTFIFDSGQGTYKEMKIHYCRDGKELWRKDLAGHGRGIGKPFLSPDGSYILAISDMETGGPGIKCFDAQGRLLWHKHKEINWLYHSETSDFDFSSDSRYFWATSRADGNFYLFNSNGDLLMQKKYSDGIVRGGYVQISSLDEDLYQYIPRPPDSELPRAGVYDLNGNFIMPNPGTLSDDGTKGRDISNDKIKIFEFPSLVVVREYNLNFNYIGCTEDLNFIFGTRDKELYIIDTRLNTIFKRIFPGELPKISFSGKYFILRSLNENKIWFYELIF